VIQRLLELGLFGGKLLDNLLGRHGRFGDVHGPEARVERHGGKAVLALRRGGQGAGHSQKHRQRSPDSHFILHPTALLQN
jgi:hypothetical protein